MPGRANVGLPAGWFRIRSPMLRVERIGQTTLNHDPDHSTRWWATVETTSCRELPTNHRERQWGRVWHSRRTSMCRDALSSDQWKNSPPVTIANMLAHQMSSAGVIAKHGNFTRMAPRVHAITGGSPSRHTTGRVRIRRFGMLSTPTNNTLRLPACRWRRSRANPWQNSSSPRSASPFLLT